MTRFLRTLLALSAAAAQAGAQPAAKKPITQDVYDLWRVIRGQSLSRDGQWTAYTVTPQVGDGELVVRATKGATEYRLPRGWTGRPITSVVQDSPFVAPPSSFSADSRWLAVITYAPKAEYDRTRRRPAAAQPRNSLALVELSTGKVTSVPRVRSFAMPRMSGRYIAYLLEGDTTARAGGDSAGRASAPGAQAGAAAASPGGGVRPVASDSSARRNARRREYGTTLVLRDLASGAETRVDDVLAYSFTEGGDWLGYTVASRTPGRDGAYARSLADGKEHALLTGTGTYRGLVFDRAGRQLAFVASRDSLPTDRPRFSLYHAPLGASPTARVVVTPAAVGSGLHIAERGRVDFTRDGSAILFGVAMPAPDSIPADSLADKAVLDLWHYQEPRLQPQQKLEANRERDRSYTTLYQIKLGKVVRLASDSMPQVTVSDDGRVALTSTSVPYAVEQMWGDDGSDVYVFDATTGKRTPVAKRVEFGAQLSPAGRYALWFDKGRWHSYNVATGKAVDLTSALRGVRFDQETWDTPSTSAPWGVAGWTNGDRSVLLYSRYDVWDVDPTGARPARVVTDSVGAKNQISFRVVDLDPEDRFIDPAKPLLLRAFDDRTKASGFWRDVVDATRAPERIIMADRRFGAPIRARDAEMYVATQETYREFPDLWVGSRLDSLTRISDANPQQKDYPWGTAELVSWNSDDNQPLQGILYKPENFDPSKKYPLITYFYEQLSDNLHGYQAPAGRNTINPTVYTSLGYLVFFPDIAYTNGYPGQSALHSIVPGLQMLIARGYVNPKAIGTAGQSWGGYQTAYMITQTPIFAAAFAGAPVANMTSAYGGIRWESGIARAFQYEKAQSRIGGSIWQMPLRYIENSPLFYVDRVQTPVLIMSNDADGAVPWYQGIELFVGLRRFGKEAYLVSYNGDGHNPRKRANQKDIDMRMQQFFAHHLMGAPSPQWMVKGIPFLQKGRDQLAPAATAGAPAGTGQDEPETPRD